MKVIIDIEANALYNPTQIWLVICKDIETGQIHIFRNLTTDDQQKRLFRTFTGGITLWIGHNVLGYDAPVIQSLLDPDAVPSDKCLDTLVLSKLIDYSRPGHSVEQYGEEFGLEKIKNIDYSKYSKELEEYCIRDVEITYKIYLKYLKQINDKNWEDAIRLEHQFQLVVNSLSNNGFSFNTKKAQDLLKKVDKELKVLDNEILKAFPPRSKLIREYMPRATKHGTISRTSVPRGLGEDLGAYSVESPFSYFEWEVFNPSSHKQLIQVLNDAGWKPTDKTTTHIQAERELNKLKYTKNKTNELDLAIRTCHTKLHQLAKTGWKINEQNLSTLPPSAPSPARTLAKRILLEARRRTLTEWLSLVCFEIKINKESTKLLGQETKEELTQNGEQKKINTIEKTKELTDKKETWKNTVSQSFTTISNISDKKNVNEDTTLKVATTLQSKILIEWLKCKKVNAEFVKENASFLWITVTGLEKLEDFYVKAATFVLDGLKQSPMTYTITSERVKGKFIALGAWTGRMAHQAPNTANIPNDLDTEGKTKLYGKEMRSLWQAPRNRLLVGVDAEGIQLRIFAHYIDDQEFTDALVRGRKSDGSDPHSLNRRIIGDVCKSRQAAKRFIYALLLGAGIGKLAQILQCSDTEAREALDRILERYTGFAKLKTETIPKDASRGYFIGLDGRAVPILGDSAGQRKHLAMSGYLQSGEAIVIKRTAVEALDKLIKLDMPIKLVDIVHDEYVIEVKNDVRYAHEVKRIFCRTIEEVGQQLKLKCPLAGDGNIGINWAEIH